MDRLKWVIAALLIAVPLTGCSTLRTDALPAYDEVLVYDLPFDLTFLRTLEAVESVEGWELDGTEKEKGIIRARNTEYANFSDADKRQATILIKRLNRKQSSVELAPYAQRVIGGTDIMNRIDQYVSSELPA